MAIHPAFVAMSHIPFKGQVPDDLLYDTETDMWLRQQGDEVLIGATAFGIFLAGEIIAFTCKPKGAEVDRGRGLGTVECAKTVLAVHAPISFTLLEGNDDLEEHPLAINHDAYASWMVRALPLRWQEESTRLVDAAAYRAHIRRSEPEAEFV